MRGSVLYYCTEFILEDLSGFFIFCRFGLLIGKHSGVLVFFFFLGLWETNAPKPGITRKFLYHCGNLSNHYGLCYKACGKVI